MRGAVDESDSRGRWTRAAARDGLGRRVGVKSGTAVPCRRASPTRSRLKRMGATNHAIESADEPPSSHDCSSSSWIAHEAARRPLRSEDGIVRSPVKHRRDIGIVERVSGE